MLGKRYSREIEEKWQKWWRENNIYAFQENSEKEIYSIDTPPPFTSGELHMGHVLSYSFFDFVARYKRMKGYNVFYPQGWDTQGFPTEVKVEKKYGQLPPEEFRKKCIEWTEEMIKRMKEQMNKMGFSADWKYEYRTMDPEYHKKVQLSLIEMYNKNHIYRAKYPVFWCTKCKSAIAKAELDDVEREAFLNYITFEGPNKEDLTIATTRPELIPACVALMFNPEDERYKKLEGKKAKTPLGEEVPIIADKDVDKEFGTGLMMVCTFGDKMDVVWAHRHSLPFKQIIDERGYITAEPLKGLKVDEGREKIIEILKEKGVLKKQEKKPQTVKVHDRCKTPVEFLISMQWFADIKKSADEIRKWAHEIEWVPSFGINYLLNWLDNAEWDWVISRQRIFGTPLPFYYCEKCGKTATAEKLPFYPEKAEKKMCECGEVMKAEESVADCWIDSSITPLIIAGWPEKEFTKKYPSSLRPQGVEIVRTWAFYTIYRCGVLTGKAPFKTVLLNGNVLAPDGKKMSKSLGNVISPQELWEKYPVDAIRQWAAMSGAMAKDRPFSYEDLNYAKSFLNKLWNSSRFIEKSIKDFDGSEGKKRKIDRWIENKLKQTIKEVGKYMERFEFHHAIHKIHYFYWHYFCDYYIEYVKHRIYEFEKYGEESKKAAQHTLYNVLYNTIKLLAPITPHITEEIWHEVFGKENSIHLSEWPKVGEEEVEEIKEVEKLNEIISNIRKFKVSNRMAMNAPIKKAVIPKELKEFEEDIKGTVKIEEIEWGDELIISKEE